jgi:chromosome segregation protein
MHLKSLEIQGFKSFPERTVIEFHEGVTAIIGPNGSGKSNVTDAIRWVLGEQSVKTLRGSRMEDVIFSGTSSRRAMSYAEVTMTIDNSDGILPLEYAEVQVTRRLYRSGESEYLLNKTACRLRDIAMLFMDTGLGRDGYSIVGQGRVDDILSHRSEDRRRIFEEASGIVKYRTRKEEAERKLQTTEQNLLRINDIIRELEDRIEPLAEQSAAARRFLALRDELKGLEVALMLDSIDQNQQKLQEAADEKRLLELDLLHENSALLDLKEHNHQVQDEMRAIDEQMERAQQDYNQISLRIGEISSQIALNEEKMRQCRDTARQAAEAEQELGTSIGDLAAEVASRKKKEETLQRQLTSYRQRLGEAEEEMLLILQTLDASEKKIEQLKANQDQLLEQVYEDKATLAQTQGQTGHVENRRKAIQNENRELTSDRDRLNILREESESQIGVIRRETAKIEADRAVAAQNLEASRQRCNEASRQLDQDRQNLQNRQYRHKTLSELEKSYEGYGEAIRRLFTQADSDPQFGRGIRGTLGSLIRVEQVYELAIETALGPAVQNIVTDTEETAQRLIDYLKTTRSGRATFLPIASIRGRQLEAGLLGKLAGLPGYVGVASELVQAAADLTGILEFLLGRVVLAERLDQAVQMARKTGYACRIVTLEGDVVNPGGSMTGGFNRANNQGVLSRSREIGQLQLDIQQLSAVVASREAELPALEQAMQEAARQLAALEKAGVEQSHVLVREEARLASLVQDQEKTQARQQLLQVEDEQLQTQALQIRQEIGRQSARISAMENDIAAIRQAVSEQEGSSRAEQEKRNDLRETITELRVSTHSIEESLVAAQEMSDRLEQEQQGQQARLARYRHDQARCAEDIEKLQAACAAFQEQSEAKRREGAAVSEEAKRLAQQKNELEISQASFFDQLEAAAGRLASLQGEIGRAEAKVIRFESQVDEIKNRLWEEYEMTADQAAPWRRQLDNRGEVTRQVNSLKNNLRQIGSVNLAAIEEYQAVSERYQFMATQRDDIEKAMHQLTSVIDELTVAMKQQFIDHFHLINENFKVVFAELFGGGMAEVLLEDEQDVLSCGIEIRAQPPGKKLQNLLLLSGGERCLTANALLFAILKLRPTPFCVLDEVEAALDDANVSRFTDYIRRYAEESQFILVTHRKGTMEAADRLYGVTMQERGVSRILSMELAD